MCMLVCQLTTQVFISELLFPYSVSLLNSIHSDIDGYFRYLLHHTTADCTQLLPLSVLLHIVNNHNVTESSSVLLATKELLFPLIYSFSSGLQEINDTSSTDGASLCQYRSVVTEYCLDKLCYKIQSNVKLLPLDDDDDGITLNNRQRHCEQLQQLLNNLWSFCCTSLTDPNHHQ